MAQVSLLFPQLSIRFIGSSGENLPVTWLDSDSQPIVGNLDIGPPLTITTYTLKARVVNNNDEEKTCQEVVFSGPSPITGVTVNTPFTIPGKDSVTVDVVLQFTGTQTHGETAALNATAVADIVTP